MEERQCLAAHCEQMNHQAARLVRLRDAGFEAREGLGIVPLQHQQVCVDHPMIVWQFDWTDVLQSAPSRLAALPIVAAPTVIEQPASGGQHLGVTVEPWIADTRAQRHGFFDRSYAAIRIDEAERTNEKAQCGNSSERES